MMQANDFCPCELFQGEPWLECPHLRFDFVTPEGYRHKTICQKPEFLTAQQEARARGASWLLPVAECWGAYEQAQGGRQAQDGGAP